MTTKPATANTFFVTFHGVDCLNIGPFPTYEAAQSFGETSVFHATGQAFEVHGLVAPRPDLVAEPVPGPVDRTALLAALVAAKKGATAAELAQTIHCAKISVSNALFAMKERGEAFCYYAGKGRIWHAEATATTPTGVGVQSTGVGVQSDAPLFRQEFPDFDYEIPAIPGMLDHSWHNDVCPSLVGNGFQLWCDYADPKLRETEGGDRFALYVDLDGSMGDLILSSDSLDDIKAAMATATTAA